MKILSFKPLLEWFGFTRRERRATFFLLILILFVAGFRFIIPGQNITVEKIPVDIFTWTDTLLIEKDEGVTGHIKQNRPDFQRPLLEINTCDSAALEALPGIGPVLSVRIIKFRKLLGGFASVEQLREVYGLSEEVFNLISPRLYADTTYINKIIINDAGFKDLIRLPYFESYEVTAILKYRDLQGRIANISELTDNKLISSEKVEKVRPYLDFGK
jgi:DNA uptake protein ComE-like DNA-binding protein